MSVAVKQQDQVQANLAPAAELQSLRRTLMRGVLRSASIVGFIVAAAATLDAVASDQPWTIPFYWVAYAIVLLLTLWRRAPYGLQVWAVIALLYILGVLDFVEDGPSGSGRVFMLIIPFLAGVFLGRRESIWALVFCSLTMAAFGLAFSTGALVSEENIGAESPSRWIAGTLALFMLGLLIVVSLGYLLPRLNAALGQTTTLAQALEEQRAGLEQAVQERTADLERRSLQLATAAQVAREAAAIQDLERLLSETTVLISQRFGFYHCGVFLLDDTRTYAVLRAASSPGGQRMLDRGHGLRVGQVGIVGFVTDRGTPRIALDVGSDAVFFENPDLPDTRSEIALPLRARGRIIGALDVQSTKAEAFDQDDVAVLQTMSDQIALAISNAQLFEQLQTSIEAERRASGEASLRSWSQALQKGHGLHRRFDPDGILATDFGSHAPATAENPDGKAIGGTSDVSAKLTIPIKVRGNIIGLVDAHRRPDAGVWTPDEIALMETVTDELGAALEGARLFRDSQKRATYEQMTADISTRLRETLDMETVLRTAAQELRQALALPEVTIRLGTPPTPRGTDGNGRSLTESLTADDEELAV